MEAYKVENVSFLQKAKDFIKNKKTQLIGATVLAGSMALAGCAPLSLEKRVITPNEFVPGRLVTLTGEVMPGYKDTDYRSDVNILVIPYNSEGPFNLDIPLLKKNNVLLFNAHEDWRFGINDDNTMRLKKAANSGEYAIRIYGRTTYGSMEYDLYGKKIEVPNVDIDFISFTDKTGDIKLTLETDMDPIVAFMGTSTVPINVNPDISYGLQGSWHYGLGSMFDSMSWFAWVSDWSAYGPSISLWWSAMGQDWDGDGIPNYMDSYPYDPANTVGREGYFNTYAGLNLHNFIAARNGNSKLMIPEEGARLHPAFVDLFAKNRQADEYRQRAIAQREALISKNYQTNEAKNNVRKGEMKIPSLEQVAKSMGIRREQLDKHYNNVRVNMPGMYSETGMRGGMIGSGGGSGTGGGYFIPGSGSSLQGSAGERGGRDSGGKSGSGEKK